ncbi:MAG: hypothetical protein IKN87_02250 [Bacilli bacterium]|nr:hypothetical protein [Bacilli bacterium]
MKKIVLSLVVVLSVVLLVGCGKKNDQLIGSWKGETEDGLVTTFTFEKDNKVKYDNEYGFSSEGTYKKEDKYIYINLESWTEEKKYEYTLKDDKLDLKATDLYSPSYKGMKKQK